MAKKQDSYADIYEAPGIVGQGLTIATDIDYRNREVGPKQLVEKRPVEESKSVAPEAVVPQDIAELRRSLDATRAENGENSWLKAHCNKRG